MTVWAKRGSPIVVLGRRSAEQDYRRKKRGERGERAMDRDARQRHAPLLLALRPPEKTVTGSRNSHRFEDDLRNARIADGV
jgi:hypothetical protein